MIITKTGTRNTHGTHLSEIVLLKKVKSPGGIKNGALMSGTESTVPVINMI